MEFHGSVRPLATIPSPTQSVWHLGQVPIRAYALCIVLGIVAACVVTELRLRRRGAPPNLIYDIVLWAVPFGIIGGRLYHVITTPQPYFGKGGNPVDAFKLWNGGLGIWGAVLCGALGVWIACKQIKLPFVVVAGAIAPALPLAQAIGRWGNWFNNELYGDETSLPWGLRVYRWDLDRGAAETTTNGDPMVLGVFHPTFLYESVWDLGVAVLVWLADRRFKFGKGRAFALYVATYCVGRFWVEAMRSDPATNVLGMRLNNWTALIVFLAATAYFLMVRGPQERIVVAEDGTMTMVTGDGDGDRGVGGGTGAGVAAGTGAVSAGGEVLEDSEALEDREAFGAPEGDAEHADAEHADDDASKRDDVARPTGS